MTDQTDQTDPNNEGFDLADFDTSKADEGADMTLEHPVSGEPLLGDDGEPITITLRGSDSKAYRNAQRDRTNKRLSKRRPKLTAEQSEADGLEILIACFVGWSGNFRYQGEILEPTQANFRKVATAQRWLREQADEFVHDRGNFTRS